MVFLSEVSIERAGRCRAASGPPQHITIPQGSSSAKSRSRIHLGGELGCVSALDTATVEAIQRALFDPRVLFIRFMVTPPLGSILKAVQLPSIGGDTCLASIFTVCEALSLLVQHYAVPDDDERRVMDRVTLESDRPF